MKKLLSILCTLALVLGVVLVPGMFSASAAATDVTFVAFAGSTMAYTDTTVSPAVNAYGIPQDDTGGSGWGAPNYMVSDFELEKDATYVLTYDWRGHNYENPIWISAADKAESGFANSGKRVVAAEGSNKTAYKNLGVVFEANDVISDTHKYLAIALQDYGNDPYLLTNVKIEKIVPDSNYLIPVGFVNNIYAAVDNGVPYYHAYGWYAQSSLVFDYEVEADKYYKLTFDYKGQNRNSDSDNPNKLLKVAAVDSLGAIWSESNGLLISSVTGVNHSDSFRSYEFTFKGSDAGASDTNKYFAIQHGYTYSNFYLKNVKLEEVEAPSGGEGEGEGGEGEGGEVDTTPGASAQYPLYDEDFIYPTKTSDSITVSADNVKSYKWDKDHTATTVSYRPTYGWSSAKTATGVLTFDVELTAGNEYILELDRIGNYTPGNEIRIGTADADGNADFTKSVTLEPCFADQWSSYWHEGIAFNANDVINGTKTYLAIEINSSNTKHLVKNFKLNRVTREKGYLYPAAYGKSMAEIAEDGKVVYAQTDAGAQAWMVFNYQLEAGKTYQVEFDYYGHYRVQENGWNWAFSAAASTDIDANSKSDIFKDNMKDLGIPYVSNEHTGLTADKAYKHVSVMLNADDIITATNNYLVIHSSGYDTMPFLKNFKITEFNASGTLPVTLGRETLISIEDGEVVVGVTVSYSGNSWMKFDVELQPDTEYLLSYDFRGHSYLENPNDTRLSVFCVADPYSAGHPKDNNEINLDKQGPLLAIANTQNAFTHKVITFNSNDVIDGDKKYFTIYGQGYPDKWTFKNIFLIEKPESDGSNLLFNGDFDDEALGKEFWNAAGVTTTRVTTENHSENGSAALNIKGSKFSNANQLAVVERNTDYELSFWYKGYVGQQALVGISRDIAEYSRRYMFAYATAPKAQNDTWTKCTVTFNSGDRDIVNVGFIAGEGSDYYVDDIVLAPANTAGQYNANTLITEPYVNYEQSFNRYKHWTAAAGKNLIENGDFEGAIPASWGSFISGSNGVLSIVDGEGYDATAADKTGGKALKFEAKGLDKADGGYIYIDGLKANTDYVLSYWTRAPYWAPDNDADMTHGIANVFDGNQYFTFREEVRGNQVLTQDNQWHRTTIKFNTGLNTRVAYAIMGANTTAYIDNLQVFTVEDAVDARPEVMLDAEKNRAYVTNTAPTNIYVGASKNLVKNGNFEATNSTFWSDKDTTIGYKNVGDNGLYYDKYVTLLDWNGVAEVKDSGTSRGNALYYKSNTNITGLPLGTAYVKYFDVEPNTEYTFVADYVIVKAYNNPGVLGVTSRYKAGDFGIAMVNSLNPIPIASINFYDNYNSNLAWQKMTVTFNTNGYEQVGIYIRDRGGEAYFDNISLFKASDGSATPVIEPEIPDDDDTSSDSGSSGGTSSGGTGSEGTGSEGTGSEGTGSTPVLPPEIIDGEIESDEYDVVGEKGNKTIYGVAPGATVKDVLDSLADKQNIKAFDAEGNEVTDTSVPVGSGFSFRYMDGFASVDAAIVLIRGDIDSDGYITSADMRLMMRAIVNSFEEGLDASQMTVADIDEDGYITSHDIALISMHIGGVKALEPIVVEQ